MKKVSITFLKHKTTLEDVIKDIENTDADYFHVDVMDGKFVPPIVLPIEESRRYLSNTTKPLDVHLMVEHPKEYIDEYLRYNKTAIISVHVEINEDLNAIIDLIHSHHVLAGLAIKNETDLKELEPYLDKIDYIIIMAIIPGYGGQKMIPESLDKIPKLVELREKNNYHYLITVDGGVNEETRPLLEQLDVITSGSYVCMSENFQEKINTLR